MPSQGIWRLKPLSVKIEDMRSLSWPLAAVAITAMVVIGVLAMWDKDVAAISGAITTVLLVLGIAELKEIKTQTNGTSTRMLDELAASRRTQERITDKALSNSGAITPVSPAPEEFSDHP